MKLSKWLILAVAITAIVAFSFSTTVTAPKGKHARIALHKDNVRNDDVTINSGEWVKFVSQDYHNDAGPGNNHIMFLTGPGVSANSGIMDWHDVWELQLTNTGVYTFFCSVHPTTMNGQITVG